MMQHFNEEEIKRTILGCGGLAAFYAVLFLVLLYVSVKGH